MDYGIYYTRYPSVLEGSSDAIWIIDQDDHTSTSGFLILVEELFHGAQRSKRV